MKTVSLEITNKTDEPSIEVAVQKALRAELQMDGRLEVRSKEEADTVLSVTLTKFSLDPLSYVRNQGSLVAEYRVTLTCKAVLSDAQTGEVILETPVVLGDADFSFTADLTSAKRAALPLAASDLARKVVSATVTAW
ncbi:MAG: LPS assembly lipoprotein LptE [Kiritimatiellales bacterium]